MITEKDNFTKNIEDPEIVSLRHKRMTSILKTLVTF